MASTCVFTVEAKDNKEKRTRLSRYHLSDPAEGRLHVREERVALPVLRRLQVRVATWAPLEWLAANDKWRVRGGTLMRDNSRTSMIKGIPIHPTHNVPRRKKNMFLSVLALALFCIVGTVSPTVGTVFAESGSPQKETQVQADVQRLEGRWVRPDGGYILELRDIKRDGSLMAAYFNPRPIKVFSAKWSREDGKINLFVELRDFNYPGSKYNLQYEPRADRLKGTYFQAVERQTFNIEFVRVKSKKEGQ
jgi:hypothetical protein